VQDVLFTDFLLADCLTSLAKPVADLALVGCHFASGSPIALSLIQGFDPGVHPSPAKAACGSAPRCGTLPPCRSVPPRHMWTPSPAVAPCACRL
jgi:hypothetical protein